MTAANQDPVRDADGLWRCSHCEYENARKPKCIRHMNFCRSKPHNAPSPPPSPPPDVVRPPMSAYDRYFLDNIDKFLEEYPDATGAKSGDYIGAAWEALPADNPDKARYISEYDEEYAEFERALAAGSVLQSLKPPASKASKFKKVNINPLQLFRREITGFDKLKPSS